MTTPAPKIRPENPDAPFRQPFKVGQVWALDDGPRGGDPELQWLVLETHRIIALFAGGEDHTPESLYHTYGDHLYLRQTATVYASCYASDQSIPF